MTEEILARYLAFSITPESKYTAKHLEGTNFFLIKGSDEVFEVTVKGNIDPGAWED